MWWYGHRFLHFQVRPCVRAVPKQQPQLTFKIHIKNMQIILLNPKGIYEQIRSTKSYQSLETVFKECCHRTIQMAFDTNQIVSFVRINLLFKQNTLARERFGQQHTLLIVHIIISRSMNQ